MNDRRLVESVARRFISHRGAAALPFVREQAEVADAIGDRLSAETWRDIADAAGRMVSASRDGP